MALMGTGPPSQLRSWTWPSAAGELSWLPTWQRLSVFPRLAEELETQSSGRCCAEHGQATSEGRLAGAEA